MKLTRKDVLKKSIKRPLGKLRWEDLRGTMRDFAEANCVTVHEGGKVKIMKDRQGWYLKLKRDENGCVNESDLNESSADTAGVAPRHATDGIPPLSAALCYPLAESTQNTLP